MLSIIKESFTRNLMAKLAGFFAYPALSYLKKRIDPARYNGASMLGLNGIVVKSHGGANEIAFQNAIEEAVLQAKSNVVDRVRNQITDFINEGLLL
jgi:glycerol-3-phosphate acyltransferase PlsX